MASVRCAELQWTSGAAGDGVVMRDLVRLEGELVWGSVSGESAGRNWEQCFTFFFFQAEDGIRDKLVTGVQTCALPISWRNCGTVHDQSERIDQRERN